MEPAVVNVNIHHYYEFLQYCLKTDRYFSENKLRHLMSVVEYKRDWNGDSEIYIDYNSQFFYWFKHNSPYVEVKNET